LDPFVALTRGRDSGDLAAGLPSPGVDEITLTLDTLPEVDTLRSLDTRWPPSPPRGVRLYPVAVAVSPVAVASFAGCGSEFRRDRLGAAWLLHTSGSPGPQHLGHR